MKPKLAMMLSLAVTAFVLIIISSVVSRSVSAAAEQNAPAALEPEVQQVILERDAAYNELLTEANNRIKQLQSELDAVQEPTLDSGGQNVGVTPEQAALIAGEEVASGATPDGLPELVSFEEKIAYEVPFKEGNLYIDAQTGEVLFNGTIIYAQPTIGPQDAVRLASNYLGKDKNYNTETTTLNGETVYKVKFKSGEVIFVNQQGQLVLVRLSVAPSGNGGDNNTVSQSGEDDDDDGDDEKDDDKDDD